jgi:hypothetical protein
LHFIRNIDGEAFEFPRPAHLYDLLPIPASAQLPLLHIETGSIVDPSVAGSNPEHMAYESTVSGYAYSDRDDYRYRQEVSTPTRGRGHMHASECPLSLAFSPRQPSNGEHGALDRPLPGFRVYGRVYTDDAKMKLGHGIRRQCFNCGATETNTWRHSKLSLGKLVRLAQSSK